MPTTNPSSEEPAPLEALESDRRRIERILSRLEVTTEPVERADLGAEMVRAASRYEDVLERAVLPFLGGRAEEATLADLDRARDELRETMAVIHDRTKHVDPRNVHAPDPEGFEDALSRASAGLRAQLDDEDRQVDALWANLGPDDRQRLAREVGRAARNASERPHPPRTAIGRLLVNAHVKADHTFEDVPAPRHPGAETVND